MRVVARIAKNPSGYMVIPPARHMSAIDFSATFGASGFAGASAAGAAFCSARKWPGAHENERGD